MASTELQCREHVLRTHGNVAALSKTAQADFYSYYHHHSCADDFSTAKPLCSDNTKKKRRAHSRDGDNDNDNDDDVDVDVDMDAIVVIER